MTKQEVNKLLALMRANYGSAFKGMSQQDKYLLLNTWTFTPSRLGRKHCDDRSDWSLSARANGFPLSPKCANSAKSCTTKLWARCAITTTMRCRNGRKKAYCSIAEKTNRLRGDGTAEMTLDVMLDDPELAALATGHEHKMLMDGMDDTLDEKPQR